MRSKRAIQYQTIFLTLALLTITMGTCSAAVFNLKAEATTITMPDGQIVPMWGFGLNNAPGDPVTIPGPLLVVPPGDTTLTINLTNNLTVAVSLVIPGQLANMAPVWDDGAKEFRTAGNYSARVKSFTTQTFPGATRTYKWTNIKPGTYLYQSGFNPAVQIQMGLYGGVKADAAANNVYGQTESAYNAEAVLLFSEVDPVFNQAVADGKYGPNKKVKSAVAYAPKYFLINGQAYPDLAPIAAGNAGQQVLLRFLNAGLQTHVPVVQGSYMTLLAEDGNLYPYSRKQYSLEMAAGKTFDALITPAAAGQFAIYDRRLNLTNAGSATPGGMFTYLQVSP